MPKTEEFEPRLVEFVPKELEPGVIYISIKYRTTVHLCASGCGNKVVLPLGPAQWNITWDGETISMSPSVGNWEYPCESHYWIRRNLVQWAPKWSRERIERGRERDGRALDSYFGTREAKQVPPTGSTSGKLAEGKRD